MSSKVSMVTSNQKVSMYRVRQTVVLCVAPAPLRCVDDVGRRTAKVFLRLDHLQVVVDDRQATDLASGLVMIPALKLVTAIDCIAIEVAHVFCHVCVI